MNIAIGYARCSTAIQESSIDQQKHAIEKYAGENGFQVAAVFEDDGISGVTADRPAFENLFAFCEAGVLPELQALIVYDVSRFGRFKNPEEVAYWRHVLRKLDIELLSVNGENGSGLGEQILRVVESHEASEYSRKLSGLVRRGSRHNAERGYFNGGRTPYGYARMLCDPATGEDIRILKPGERKAVKSHRVKLVPGDRREIDRVQLIFEDRKRGATVKEIADYMNRRVWPSPAGKEWSKQQVSNILRNPVYWGAISWKDRGGRYEETNQHTLTHKAHTAIVKGENHGHQSATGVVDRRVQDIERPNWHAFSGCLQPKTSGRIPRNKPKVPAHRKDEG